MLVKDLDKKVKASYPTGSATDSSANPEHLSKGLEKMRKELMAFAACLAILPADACKAAATTSEKPLPPLVAEAPTATAEDMWVKYPQFFSRFKDIWTYCPVELELQQGIRIAKWYNDNTALYDRMIRTCKADLAHAPMRAWPPTAAAAKLRKERFFSRRCQGQKCDWVQTQ